MKKFLLLFLLVPVLSLHGQTPNDVLNLLIANKTISQEQADSIRADAAIKQQDADANKKSFPASAARSIQFAGYTQMRYQVFDEKTKRDGFDIRRARFDIKGNFTPFFGYRLQADFAGSPKLLDAYAEIKLNDYFQITAGQFRIPFSLENLTSMNKFEVIDFAQAVDALTARGKDVIGNHNGRDIGIQLGGALIKKGTTNYVEYRIGVFNGSGINIADTANDAKDVVGRLIINPVKGLSFGTSYYNGWGKAIKPAAEFKGRSQARNRFGIEASYTATRFMTKAEYLMGKDGKTDKAGWYAMAGYFVIPQKLQLVARYDTFDPDKDKDDNIGTNYVFGANLNFNSWSRLQAFYTIKQEQGTAIKNNYLSIQYQIGF
ncbi:MAG TPA: porin [Bacteroidales bacterium]|nr:porin [Bacteroidales bacterium]